MKVLYSSNIALAYNTNIITTALTHSTPVQMLEKGDYPSQGQRLNIYHRDELVQTIKTK